MGRTTRAGYNGSMTTDRLKDLTSGKETGGFGVFAYYTPLNSEKYTYWRSIDNNTSKTVLSTNYTEANTSANFMYNQQVKWNSTLDDSYITKWQYSPIKYWPNEISNTGVDDQPNDLATDPATGDRGQYGHVSFFAYAPYVFVTTASDAKDFKSNSVDKGKEKTATNAPGYENVATGETQRGERGVGITNITSNDATGDPIVDYVLASDGKNVDLLWGTADNTSANAVGNAQSGSYTGYVTLSGTTYGKASKWPVNINLTKQTTTGTVNFAFKHALAKVGGSTNPDLPASAKNGLMVVLDLDDQMGGETGGQIEALNPGYNHDNMVKYL